MVRQPSQLFINPFKINFITDIVFYNNYLQCAHSFSVFNYFNHSFCYARASKKLFMESAARTFPFVYGEEYSYWYVSRIWTSIVNIIARRMFITAFHVYSRIDRIEESKCDTWNNFSKNSSKILSPFIQFDCILYDSENYKRWTIFHFVLL